ncbi:tryptophan synthase subunit alpha [Streptomyces sp. NPDC002867]
MMPAARLTPTLPYGGRRLTPAAAWLTERLNGPRPQLGVFLPAGFPDARSDVIALRLFAAHGAGILEVGIPHTAPVYDGALITAAYQAALGHGTGVVEALETVHRAAVTTTASVVVMTYWAPVRAYGVDRFADDLAAAGAAGAMIVDLPDKHADSWVAAARVAGIHTPHFVRRDATNAELCQVAARASGWLYAPAADARTGYTGALNIIELQTFTHRLRSVAATTPVVTGIGISTPTKAATVQGLVDGVVVGTPIVRPLLQLGASAGLRAAAQNVAAFADSLHAD